jgi:hypothetical protein
MPECSIIDIKSQNQNFNTFIEKNETEYSKTGYVFEQIRVIDNVNFYLFWIYIFLIFVYVYFLFTNGKKMTLYMKAGIVSMFIVYPFVITKIEVLLWYIFKYLYDTMLGNPYTLPDY